MDVQVIGANGILETARIDQDEQTVKVRVPVGQTNYVRAQLVEPEADDLIVRALTNPIYVE